MSVRKPSPNYDAFRVGTLRHVAAQVLHRTRGVWRRFGQLESASLADDLAGISIDRPVYIAGLARAGSTILLEILAQHAGVVTHRYRDFWTIFTPYVWERALAGKRSSGNDATISEATPVERAHGDGILVTDESPEAMEEILWMTFFRHLHDPRVNNVLDGQTDNAAFERFLSDHIRKLLLVRGRQRYVAKANYNMTRLQYLLKMFPDTRLIVPVRNPRDHIASLQKQHQLLCEAQRIHPRSIAWLDCVGHFEFGPHRVPVNTGNRAVIESIEELWREGDDIRGWARYWTALYGDFHARLTTDKQLRDAVLIVRHEDLCDAPAETLTDIATHCGLEAMQPLMAQYEAKLHRPAYYSPSFTAADERAIVEETDAVATLFGYANSTQSDGRPEAVWPSTEIALV